jgi:hypothetical protein
MRCTWLLHNLANCSKAAAFRPHHLTYSWGMQRDVVFHGSSAHRLSHNADVTRTTCSPAARSLPSSSLELHTWTSGSWMSISEASGGFIPSGTPVAVHECRYEEHRNRRRTCCTLHANEPSGQCNEPVGPMSRKVDANEPYCVDAWVYISPYQAQTS